MRGIHHGARQSLTSLRSVDTQSTRSISSASVTITIEDDTSHVTELNESSPLLGNYWQNGHNIYRDYGIIGSEGNHGHHGQQKSKFLSLNNHDRFDVSSNKFSTSMYHYETGPNLYNIRIFGILFILASGLIIGTYLMIVESRIPQMSFTLDLVSRDIWSRIAMPTGSLLNHSSFMDVLMLHTGGENCDNLFSCVDILKKLQAQQSSKGTETPYNFLVADDGHTYEVRGWNYVSPYNSIPQDEQNISLVIGFMGNYTINPPNAVLLQSALSLVKESVRRKRLLHNYRVYGLRNVTNAANDAEALFQYIAKWPRFERLLDVF